MANVLAAASAWWTGHISAAVIQSSIVDPLNTAVVGLQSLVSYGSVNGQATTFSSTSSSVTQTFNQFATGSFFGSSDLSATSSGLKVTNAGIYQVSAIVAFSTSTVGRRGGSYSVNGSEATVPNSGGTQATNVYARTLIPAASGTTVPLQTRLISVPAGGVVGVMPYQDSGSAMTISGAELNVVRVA